MKPTEYLTITARPNTSTSITVMSDSRGPLIVASDGPGARAVRYTPEESAKFALAILEAAGVTESSDAGVAAQYLRARMAEQEQATAEAKEQAELEAEAFNLYRAYMAVQSPMSIIGDWQMLAEITKEKWLAVARKSREIGAGK